MDGENWMGWGLALKKRQKIKRGGQEGEVRGRKGRTQRGGGGEKRYWTSVYEGEK